MKKNLLFLAIVLNLKMIAQPAGWMYNQPYTVTNSNTVAAVNYQLKLTVNTQSLISMGQMLANGNDIRFAATCTGTNFFNYWIEGGLNTATTAIWVKIPLIASNTNSTVFMFYGNPSAAAASAIQGTFRGPNSATDSVSGGTSGGMLVCQRGFRFSPNQNLLVTHFGKNEPTGSLRYVTLFDNTSQAIITQTQVGGPAGSYTYGPITSPIWLTSGTQYVLQIFGLATDGYYYGASSQIGQHLTYYDMRYSNGGTQNTFPTSVLANFHYGYGDFLYYVTNTLAIVPTYTVGGNLISITPSSNFICSGNSVTLTTNATGTFSWSTGATSSVIVTTPATTTSYSVAQSNTVGCNSNAFITITVNNAVPVLTVASSAQTICPTNTVMLTASGALSYTWTGGVSNGVAFAPLSTSGYTVSGQNGCGTTTAAIIVTVTPLPVIGIANPTLVCAGNTSTLSAGGASTYTWMPGNLIGSNVIVSPIVNTIYTVTGSAGTCAGIFTLNLPTNPNPTLSASATSSMICTGESVTLTASGALNYTWSPGGQTGATIIVTPNSPTAYNVVGTNTFNCSSVASQVVITNASPTVNVVSSNSIICFGGSATLSAAGADTYSWNTGATSATISVNPNVSTFYTVVGTNTTTGCTNTQTLNVTVFIATISVTNPLSICIGSSVGLTATGAANYTWSTGDNNSSIVVSPLISTTYSVFGLSSLNGMSCSSTGTTMVTVNPLPNVTVVSTRTNICKGETATITASGASNYLWSNSTTNPVLLVNPILTTTYAVTGTDANNCVKSASIQIKVSACVGVSELVENTTQNVHIFPNPNKGEFIIQTDKVMELSLVNELGQLIRLLKFGASNDYKIEVTALSPGIYFVINKEVHFSQKIIVSN